MKEFYLLGNTGELKPTIKLTGNFVMAYSLRLWKTDDKVLELVEDIRGSCFNNSLKKIGYTLGEIPDNYNTYLLELDASISTISPITNYSIELSIEQGTTNNLQLLGKKSINGIVRFNDGGKYTKLSLPLP